MLCESISGVLGVESSSFSELGGEVTRVAAGGGAVLCEGITGVLGVKISSFSEMGGEVTRVTEGGGAVMCEGLTGVLGVESSSFSELGRGVTRVTTILAVHSFTLSPSSSSTCTASICQLCYSITYTTTSPILLQHSRTPLLIVEHCSDSTTPRDPSVKDNLRRSTWHSSYGSC